MGRRRPGQRWAQRSKGRHTKKSIRNNKRFSHEAFQRFQWRQPVREQVKPPPYDRDLREEDLAFFRNF